MVTSSEAKASPFIGVRDMTHCGMTLTDYLNELSKKGIGMLPCKAAGFGMAEATLADVMADTVVELNELAAVVLVGGVLGHGRRSLTRIIDDAKLACGSLGKNDGWLYVLDIKAASAVSFAGRCEVAAMKVNLMKGEL